MKKFKGFRLGKRLVRVWRWVRRCHPNNRAYLRLKPTESPSHPSLSTRHHHHHHLDAKERTLMASKIADWGRSLTRRLSKSPLLHFARGDRAREDDNCRRRLLLGGAFPPPNQGGRHWQQQQQAEEKDDDQALWKAAPPKGHLPVYVGQKEGGSPRRVLVPVIYFNHPLFGELLRGAEEEFGFQHPGGITITCPISDFESVRTRVAAASGVSCRHSGSRPAGWSRRWPLT